MKLFFVLCLALLFWSCEGSIDHWDYKVVPIPHADTVAVD